MTSNECRFCKAWIRWAQRNGKWRPIDTNNKVHWCRERQQALEAQRSAPAPAAKAGA